METDSIGVFHNLLSSNPVLFPRTQFTANIECTDKSFQLGKGSTFRLGDWLWDVEMEHEFSSHDTRVFATADEQPAMHVIRAFPSGTKVISRDIGLFGTCAAQVEFLIPSGNLNEIRVHPSFTSKGVYCEKEIAALENFHRPFRYHPEKSKRAIDVNARNASLGEMPAILKAAVLLAEDPGFYKHSGVDTAIIQKALADNFSDGKFSRGGSTITMQLVKNLCLSREKTLLRKAEELTLAWLVESDPDISKDQLFSLYLNIIEWGPEVYGINEASKYYFGKRPSALTADECIWLAAIIPNPKKYTAMFETNGQLNASALQVMELMRYQLWEAELLSEELLDEPVNVQIVRKPSGTAAEGS